MLGCWRLCRAKSNRHTRRPLPGGWLFSCLWLSFLAIVSYHISFRHNDCPTKASGSVDSVANAVCGESGTEWNACGVVYTNELLVGPPPALPRPSDVTSSSLLTHLFNHHHPKHSLPATTKDPLCGCSGPQLPSFWSLAWSLTVPLPTSPPFSLIRMPTIGDARPKPRVIELNLRMMVGVDIHDIYILIHWLDERVDCE